MGAGGRSGVPGGVAHRAPSPAGGGADNLARVIPRRRFLAASLALGLPVGTGSAAAPGSRILAAAPSDGPAGVPSGWRLLSHPDPIAAVRAGAADAALDGHPHWAAMPPALLCFGGLPGGLAPAVRDAWLATAEGRRLWDALHGRAGLRAVVIDGGTGALLRCEGVPASLGAPDGPVPGAIAPLARLLERDGLPAGPCGGRGFGDGSAGPPRTLTVRRGDPLPPHGAATQPPATAALLPIDWRVALANAGASFVDRLAGADDPLDRATVAAFRIRSAA